MNKKKQMHMLVCSIGSQRCWNTLHFGAEIAAALEAFTVFMGIVETDHQERRVRSALAEIEQSMTGHGLPFKVRLLKDIDAESAVLQAAENTHYDLIAVGALGKQRSWRALLASVAVRLLGQVQCSVLMIQGQPNSLKRVLICTAAHPKSRFSVQLGTAIACAAGAQTTLLHVLNAVPSMYTGLDRMDEDLADFLQSETQEAREIRWAATALESECGQVEIKQRHGAVVSEILAESAEGCYDLIVVGSPERSDPLARYLMDDVSRQVMTQADCPVLVAHPRT